MYTGLTDAEINQAMQLAGVSTNVSPDPANYQIAQAPPLPVRTLNPPPRTWSEYALIAAVVGGVGYGLYHFIKVKTIPHCRRLSFVVGHPLIAPSTLG